MVSLGCSPRVLLVDDDNDLNALLLAFLREEGYGCSLAASVEAALEMARSAPFDVILTDLFRPAHQEMFQAILPLLWQAGPTPVGVMTGWNVTAEQVAEQGFAFLIAKPFDLDDLLAAIAASAQACPTPLRQKTPLEAAPRRRPARPVRWRGADDCQAG